MACLLAGSRGCARLLRHAAPLRFPLPVPRPRPQCGRERTFQRAGSLAADARRCASQQLGPWPRAIAGHRLYNAPTLAYHSARAFPAGPPGVVGPKRNVLERARVPAREAERRRRRALGLPSADRARAPGKPCVPSPPLACCSAAAAARTSLRVHAYAHIAALIPWYSFPPFLDSHPPRPGPRIPDPGQLRHRGVHCRHDPPTRVLAA